MSHQTRTSLARALFGTALLLVVLPATAAELYQWKDANGVTHYSDAPPPSGADFTNRSISNSGTAGTGKADEAEEVAAESSQCTTARANLELLAGDGPVGTDADGDGELDSEMDADERAAQRQLAEAAMKVHCKAVASAEG